MKDDGYLFLTIILYNPYDLYKASMLHLSLLQITLLDPTAKQRQVYIPLLLNPAVAPLTPLILLMPFNNAALK